MNNLLQRRKVRAMQKEKEKEENKESRNKKVKIALGGLAASGVAYAGYKHRDVIKETATHLTSKAAEQVGRVTGNRSFQKKLQEQKNVMNAISKTYEQENAGAFNTFSALIAQQNPKDRKTKIRERTKILNKSTEEITRRNSIPQDIYNVREELRKTSYRVSQEADLKNLSDVLSGDKYTDTLGDNTQKLVDIARDSTKNKNENLFRWTMPGKEEAKEVDDKLIEALMKFNHNKDATINLNLDSEEDIAQTAKAFQEAIDIAKKRTQEQKKVFEQKTKGIVLKGDINALKDNRYAQEKLFDDSVRYRAFEKRSEIEDGVIRESLLKEGWSSLTIGDSESNVVEKNGKLFIDNKAEKEKTIDELFSPTREGKVGFGEEIKKIGQRLGVKKETINESIYSRDLYVNRETGELLNTGVVKNNLEEALDFSVKNFQTPVIKINPLQYLQSHLDIEQEKTLKSSIYREGDVSVFTGDTLETKPDLYNRNQKSVGVLNKEYVHIGDTIYDGDIKKDLLENLIGEESLYTKFTSKLDENVVAEGYEIVNTGKGKGRRYADVLSGRISEDSQDLNILQELLAVDPDAETKYKNIKERVSNFTDTGFGENQPISVAVNYNLKNYDEASKHIQQIGGKIDSKTTDLTNETFYTIGDMIADSINKDLGITGDKDRIKASMFESKEGLLDITEILNVYQDGKRRKTNSLDEEILHSLRNEIASTYEIAIDNPKIFFERNKYDKNDDLFQGNLAKLTGKDKDTVYSGEDVLRGRIQQYGIKAMEFQGINVKEELSTSVFSNTTKIVEEVNELSTRAEAIFFSKKMSSADTPTSQRKVAEDWIRHFGKDETFMNLQNIMGKVEPFGGSKIASEYESLTNTPYMAMKKHRSIADTLKDGYGEMSYDELINTIDGPFSQTQKTLLTPIFNALGDKINVITGHKGEVDTASFLPWNLANNLNRGVEKFGFGIAPDKRKSAFSTVANLSIYRFGAPIVAYQTAKSMDDFFLGGAGRRQLAQGYANLHLGVARIRDKTGMTSISKWMDDYVPGMEHLRGSPVGMRASKLSFGLVGDGRSQDEVQEYYERGLDPIRKGRWWQMGSTTPWIGDRIEYYRPNAYRRIMSDYEYTDTMHGSRREYWQNHWMPNIYNPLAPVRHFLTDPYHYEKKHEDSRPYAVTGGFASLQAIPIAGSSIDSVVSSVLKPSQKHKRLKSSHKRFLEQKDEALVNNYLDVNMRGQLNITPRGKANLTPIEPEVNIISEDTGLVDEERLSEDSIRFDLNRERIATANTLEMKEKGAVKKGPITSMKHYTRQAIESINTSIAKQSAYPSVYSPDLAGIPTNRRTYGPSMVHSQIDPYRVGQIDDVVNSTGMKDPAGQFMYAADQVRAMSGFFGYLSMNASGLVSRDDRMRLEDSSRYRDLNEGFWSLGLGGYDGLDGSLSEIGRRFTGAKQKRRYYNPIRNQMPEWMPGQDYFIDFKHGDPYKKVDYGEIRLPGEAYETIHRVQKDEHGNYSAFDRYRILADVAPYSDEYRFARSEVALLNQNNLLSEERQEEYREIRQQVSDKNKKHRFEEQRFTNADITVGTVTVDKVIDQNTFLAKEYPNNPIKLAGVGIKAEDTENTALMYSILKPGRKIEVGLETDPMGRIRDDMLDTMRGVIYAPKYSSFNRDIPLSSGQNVNYYLSKQSEEDGGKVSIKDDGTAVATRALHSEGNITIGKTMETFVSKVLPNSPFLNVLSDKFYPVRTAVQEYEGQIYSKDFRSWHRPIRDWVKPMLDKGSSMNPMLASIRGAGLAAAFSRKSPHQALFAEIGASVYGTVAGIRSIYEYRNKNFGDGEKWVPKRIEKQREFDEYFDKIQYIKYKGLYEKAKEMALKKEGVDIDAYLGAVKEDGERNDKYKNYLEVKKKNITIAGKSSNSETIKDYSKKQIKEINEELKEIDNQRPTGEVGNYTALAFRYKEEYESTLHGAQETHDYMKIHRALPKRDREFFTAFQKATPRERQKILEMVPKNQRNIYRSQWGLETKDEDDTTLKEYFSEYKMPEADWEGWRPDVSLENIKIKVMQNESMELTEADYWDEHVDRANMDPSEPIEIETLNNNLLSKQINKGRLKKALEGAGLRNVKVGMRASASNVAQFNTNMSIINNREKEIKEGIRTYLNN